MFHEVAKRDELPPGQGKRVDVAGTPVALFNVDGVFHAIPNECPHAHGPLASGILEGTVVSCPWHGWRFDVTDGTCLFSADASLRSYAVKLEGDAVLVSLELQ